MLKFVASMSDIGGLTYKGVDIVLRVFIGYSLVILMICMSLSFSRTGALSYKGVVTKLLCPFCNACDEFVNHIYIQCEFTKEIWRLLNITLGTEGINFNQWMEMVFGTQ